MRKSKVRPDRTMPSYTGFADGWEAVQLMLALSETSEMIDAPHAAANSV